MHLPAPEDVAALFQCAEPRFQAFIAVAAFAGLRLGEAAALQVGDVDYLRKTMAATRQVQRAGGGEIEVRPPRYGSERVVFLADELVELLSRHVASHCPGKGSTRWMFEASPGAPPHQNTVGYWWRKACRRADITGATHARPAALLRQRSHRRRVRRRHRPAGPRARQGDHDSEHLRTHVADRGGPHTQGVRIHDDNRCRLSCGLLRTSGTWKCSDADLSRSTR